MPRKEELEKEGWVRRSTLDEPRLSEAVEYYRELGFEVRTEPVDIGGADCVACVADLARCRVIYTRGGPSGLEDDLF